MGLFNTSRLKELEKELNSKVSDIDKLNKEISKIRKEKSK